MTRRILLPHLALALAVSATLAGGVASAAIVSYSFSGIDGVGSLKGNLDTRLGTSVGSTGHTINIADCESYTGGAAEWKFRISPLPTAILGSWQYAVAFAPPGKTCSTSNANPDSSSGCVVVATQKELSSSEITARIAFSDLIGSACDVGTTGTANIYLIIENPTTPEVQFEKIEVIVDLERPVAPTITSLSPGDGRFTVKFSDDTNEAGATKYNVYWDEVDFTEDALSTVNKKTGLSAKSVDVSSSSLENGVPVYVRVSAVDDADNESTLSNSMTVTPVDTADFWEHYKSQGGPEPGGFCFIATAAYGSPMAGELDTLRHFRDEVLAQSAPGRAFIASYYRWGRFLAAWIADKPSLRAVFRVLLVPLVWLAELALALGPLGALAALGLAWVALARARRRLAEHILRDVPVEARS